MENLDFNLFFQGSLGADRLNLSRYLTNECVSDSRLSPLKKVIITDGHPKIKILKYQTHSVRQSIPDLKLLNIWKSRLSKIKEYKYCIYNPQSKNKICRYQNLPECSKPVYDHVLHRI